VVARQNVLLLHVDVGVGVIVDVPNIVDVKRTNVDGTLNLSQKQLVLVEIVLWNPTLTSMKTRDDPNMTIYQRPRHINNLVKA